MRVVVLMVALLVTGCSAQMAHDPVPVAAAPPAASAQEASEMMAKLDDTEWRFVEVDGASVPPDVTATMRLRGSHASGKAGCNTYGARYHIAADGSASFKKAMSTRMACVTPAGAMQVEHRVFSAFQHVAKVEMQGGDLVLLNADGKTLAKLAPAGGP